MVRLARVPQSLCVLVGFLCIAYGQDGPRVQGLVTYGEGSVDSSSQQPVENAVVVLVDAQSGVGVDTAMTDATGKFLFDVSSGMQNTCYFHVLPHQYLGLPGQYWSDAGPGTQAPRCYYHVVWDAVLSVHIELSTNPPSALPIPDDSPFGAVEGIILDNQGTPLENVLVVAADPEKSPEESPVALTDRDGIFTVYRVPAQKDLFLYIIPEDFTGYPPQFWAPTGSDSGTGATTSEPWAPIIVNAYNTLFTPDILLSYDPPGPDSTWTPPMPPASEGSATVVVHLVDSTGASLPGDNWGFVELRSRSTGFELSVQQQPLDARFIFESVPEDDYWIVAEAAGYPKQCYDPRGNTEHEDYTVWVDSAGTVEITMVMTSTPKGSGYISNGVLYESGQPAIGITVELYRTRDTDAVAYSATTDPEAIFTFDGISETDYYLRLVASGYPDQWYHPNGNTVAPQYSFWYYQLNDSIPITLTNSPIDNSPDASITVKILFEDELDTTGGYDPQMFEQMRVQAAQMTRLIDEQGQTYQWSMEDSGNDGSNGFVNGIVPFMDLFPGRYTVMCEPIWEYPHQFYAPDTNTNEPDYYIDLASDDSVYIEMILVHTPKYLDPVVVPPQDTTYPTDTTWPGDSTQPWPPMQQASVTGTVRAEDGSPIPNATVVALPTSENNPTIDDCWNPGHMYSAYMAMTDSDGSYTLWDLQQGHYHLLARVDSGSSYIASFYPGVTRPTQAQDVSIDYNRADSSGVSTDSLSTALTIDFELKRGATVTGFVKSSTGQPVSEVIVNLYKMDGCGHFEAPTDQNGRFVIGGLQEGEWNVDARDTRQTYFVDHQEDYKTVRTVGTATVVLSYDIIMTPGGTVFGAFEPWPDDMQHREIANLLVYPADASEWNGVLWDHCRSNLFDAGTGRYISSAIPEGTWRIVVTPGYKPMYDQGTIQCDTIMVDSLSSTIICDTVVASGDPTGYVPSYGWTFIDGATSMSSTSPVEIKALARTEIDIEMREGYQVFGEVRGEDGKELGYDPTTGMMQGYWIAAFVEDGDLFFKVAESNYVSDGRFSMDGLIDGEEYYLHVSADGYPPQWWAGDGGENKAHDPPAAPYRFSTGNFQDLVITVVREPVGYDSEQWDDHDEHWYDENRPSAIRDLTGTPASYDAIALSWASSPAHENVDLYRIYRVNGLDESQWRPNSEGDWEPNVANEEDLGYICFDVTDTFFVDTGLQMNVDYMYAVLALMVVPDSSKDRVDTLEGEFDMPASIPLIDYTIRITHESFTKATVIMSNRWHMVGICGADSLAKPGNAGTLEAFYWDGAADSSKLYDHYFRATGFVPGEGYWLHTSTPVSLSMTTASSETLRKAGPVVLTLSKGWNQISSPYPFPVTPHWLANYSLHEWMPLSNGYREATDKLEPWKAYWIHADAPATLAITGSPAALAKKTGLCKPAAGASWELRVSLTGTNSSDLDNFVGVLPPRLSKSLKDGSPEPPRAFDFAQLYLLDGQRKLSRKYAFSTAVPTVKLEWTVGMASAEEDMQVEVSGLGNVPEGVKVFWVDNSGARDLREDNTVTVPAHPETRYGYIVATANPLDIAMYTGKFVFERNFPNPFARSTTIEFVLPYQWNSNGSKAGGETQPITLRAYNVIGRMVAEIISGPVGVGVHRVVWNGTSDSDRPLPSGLYVLRLATPRAAKSLKLFKLQ